MSNREFEVRSSFKMSRSLVLQDTLASDPVLLGNYVRYPQSRYRSRSMNTCICNGIADDAMTRDFYKPPFIPVHKSLFHFAIFKKNQNWVQSPVTDIHRYSRTLVRVGAKFRREQYSFQLIV